MASVIGTCKLCLENELRLVDSHIIPRSFYEEYKGKPLIAFSQKNDKTSTIRKGIFGQFICESCEKKFGNTDNEAFNIIKNGKDTLSLASDELKREFLVIKNANENKNILHKFALSVLWRAKNSNRQEYPSIKLGLYDEKIRLAFHTNQFEQNLLDASGLMLWEFRGSELSELDAGGYAYRTITKYSHPDFVKTYGTFFTHIFGYPYGEMLIRLGGERPKQGYFQSVEDVNVPCVLWSNNLSIKFPNLIVCKSPRARSDGSFIGSEFEKKNFRKILKVRATKNEKN